SEEEVAETMREPTMEEYMMKTQEDYGSGITRPRIDDKAHFELKGQFLKELRDNTFSRADNEDANEHIEKVLKIVDLFHILEVTQDQIMLRAFPMSLTGASIRWLMNKPSGSIITWEILKKKFLSNTIHLPELLRRWRRSITFNNNLTKLFTKLGKVKMSRDVLTIGSTMRIPLSYRGEYYQRSERFMNYLEEQTDGEAMINCIKNGDQLLPRVTQVSTAGTSSTEQPPLKDKSMWSDQEKKIQKIDRLV
nr:hypothetical protein [Tanacetum cinerariifolium]